MYEIWLGLNIFYEIFLTIWVHVLIAFVIVLLIYAFAWKNTFKKDRKRAFKPVLVLGAISFVVLFFFLPTLSGSSFDEVNYLMDYLLLFGLATGFSCIVMILFWPVFSLIYTSK